MGSQAPERSDTEASVGVDGSVGVGWLRIVGAVLCRPVLWVTALRQVFRLARRHWWRRAPFLPVPGAAYLEFRLVTMYGTADRAPVPSDVVDYLRWCRTWNAADW